MIRTISRAVVTLLLAAAPATAQSAAYSAPASLGGERIETRDALMQSYQNARWRLGKVHLDPELAISNLGYVSNIYSSAEEEAESDLRAGARAGLRAFFHLGPKVLVTPFANLDYSWWQEQKDLRSFHESFGIQLFGDFNRLQLQVQAGRVESQKNLSSELEVPVDQQHDRVEAVVNIDIRGPFYFFGSAAAGRSRFFGEAATVRIPGLDLAARDVDTEIVSGGVGYELSNGVSIGVGIQRSESRFVDDPGGRSNRGSGPLIRIDLQGSRLSLDLEAAVRDLEFDGRTDGKDRRQLTGLGQLRWRFSEKLTASLYGATQLDFSALEADAVFEGRRSGVSLGRQPGPRTRISMAYELGRDEFAMVSDDRVTRIDDFTSYSLNLHLQLTPRVSIDVGYFDTRRESSDPLFNRDLRSVTSRISVGGNLLPW